MTGEFLVFLVGLSEETRGTEREEHVAVTTVVVFLQLQPTLSSPCA